VDSLVTASAASPSAVPPAPVAVRYFWLWPALLTLLAAAWSLGTPALWADELATWGAVRLGWGELFRLLGHVDAVVGPYYAVEKAWTALAGTSPVALRLPSALAMAGAAALVAVLAARVAGQRIGLVAGLVFVVVPATSRFAQEARPYAFVVLFAILATLLLLRFLDRPGAGTGAGYAASVALLGAFHLIGLLLLLAHAVAARHRLRAWAVWTGIGVLPLLPLVWYGFRQSGQVAWIPPAHLHVVLAAPTDLFVSGEVAGALAVLGLLALSPRREVVALACWGLVPLAALAVIGQFTPLFWPRYVLYVVPAWAVLAALALRRAPRVPAAAALLAVALLGVPAQTAIRQPDGHSQATSRAGGIIADNYQPGDGIAYSMLESARWVPRDIVSRYVPAARRPADVFALTPQRVGGHLAATECADLTACLDRADPGRMWVVRMHTQADPLAGLGTAKADLLRSRFHLARLWLVKDLTVALYERT
jgi:mannosyltransferase